MAVIDSRDVIRTRMLREIARLWHYRDSEVEGANFDPLINLLVSACAVEFERSSQDLNRSNTRILEHLVEVLTPEVHTGVVPAAAVVHLQPLEAQMTLDQQTQVYVRWENQKQVQDVYFSATRAFDLFRGQVKFLVSGKSIYSYEEGIHKSELIRGRGSGLADGDCWLALALPGELQSLKGLHFFMDWRLRGEKGGLLEHLPYTAWTIQGQTVDIGVGFAQGERKEQIQDQANASAKVIGEAEAYLGRHFLHFTDHVLQEGQTLEQLKCTYPKALQEAFTVKELGVIEDTYLWIKVTFPAFLSQIALQDLYCYINCVPVLNRQQHRQYFSLRSNWNILSLKATDSFFDFHRLISQDGKNYQRIYELSEVFYNQGTFSIRRRGMNKFDKRDAQELLNELLDRLRDDSTAFTAMELDLFSSDIKELDQIVNRIQSKLLKSEQEQTDTPYLVVNPNQAGDGVYAEFWTTTGAFCNLMPIGTSLDIVSSTGIDRKSILLVTSPIGGRSKISEEEKLRVYKSALLNRGRLVTQEDIRLYCLAELQGLVRSVEVRKGIAMDHLPKRAWSRILEIVVTPLEEEYSKEEWLALLDSLQVKVKTRMSGLLPVSVVLAEKGEADE